MSWEPFGFGFESQMGRNYVVEATGDLKGVGSGQVLQRDRQH